MQDDSAALSPDAPAPRLCHLVKWADFDGYGFNLHAEKSKSGQFVGKVDEHSPAQAAGLREGDRIIEVNGVNIANENHRQVRSPARLLAPVDRGSLGSLCRCCCDGDGCCDCCDCCD